MKGTHLTSLNNTTSYAKQYFIAVLILSLPIEKTCLKHATLILVTWSNLNSYSYLFKSIGFRFFLLTLFFWIEIIVYNTSFNFSCMLLLMTPLNKTTFILLNVIQQTWNRILYYGHQFIFDKVYRYVQMLRILIKYMSISVKQKTYKKTYLEKSKWQYTEMENCSFKRIWNSCLQLLDYSRYFGSCCVSSI